MGEKVLQKQPLLIGWKQVGDKIQGSRWYSRGTTDEVDSEVPRSEVSGVFSGTIVY
jgi:hypothetical protein